MDWNKVGKVWLLLKIPEIKIYQSVVTGKISRTELINIIVYLIDKTNYRKIPIQNNDLL